MSDINEMSDDDLFMEELKQEFMQTVAKNLQELPELFKENKFEEIRRIAHDIKGMAGTFGMEGGSDIAKDLQFAAENSESEKVDNLINQLIVYMRENGVSI